MKKEDFVKIGIAEDLAAKCEAASLDELKDYIPRARMNEVSEENKTLKQSVADRDKQLEELKKFGGDNAELKKQLEELQKQNAEQQKAHEAELVQLRLDNAIDTVLTASGARNIKAVRPFIDTAKVKLGENGKLTGLDEQLREIQKTEGYLFAEKQQKQQTFKGFQPGASGDIKPGAEIDTSKMTYSELAAFMAANPDAKIN